ncbi:MAG: hypothetical protein HY514_03110 [Candidatus Aenigmarchaeota archaeon]|nr:hypothetical protein [Candidatus Aenigmarchaeota archaeon]
MKGITPVIAIILLLLITISMVGFAFVWFSRVSTTAGTNIESQLNTTLTASGKKVGIDAISAATSNVTVRNTGSATILTSEIAVYSGGALQTCTWTFGSIAPGSVASCDWSAGSCTGGTLIRVTAPGGSDENTC